MIRKLIIDFRVNCRYSRWSKAREKAWSSDMIKKAFRVTGVWPFNPEVINIERVHNINRIREIMETSSSYIEHNPLLKLMAELDKDSNEDPTKERLKEYAALARSCFTVLTAADNNRRLQKSDTDLQIQKLKDEIVEIKKSKETKKQRRMEKAKEREDMPKAKKPRITGSVLHLAPSSQNSSPVKVASGSGVKRNSHGIILSDMDLDPDLDKENVPIL